MRPAETAEAPSRAFPASAAARAAAAFPAADLLPDPALVSMLVPARELKRLLQDSKRDSEQDRQEQA